jgi:hypothetical protein
MDLGVGGDPEMRQDMVEKFAVSELAVLKNELLSGGLDAWQAAELFQVFLAGRGYGVSPAAAIDAVSRIEGSGCSLEVMQKELSSLALVQ